MYDRRRSRRFNVQSRADGTLRVVHDVYLTHEGAQLIAVSAESIAPGEAVTVAMHGAAGLRAHRATVRAVEPLTDGPELRYQWRLQLRGRRATVQGDPP